MLERTISITILLFLTLPIILLRLLPAVVAIAVV